METIPPSLSGEYLIRLDTRLSAIEAALFPVNVDVPVVSGSATVGGTLTCTMGNWEREPTTYTYAWQRDGGPIPGGGATYVVTEEDAGHSIGCVVTASNAVGSVTAPPSNVVAIPAVAAAAEVEPAHAPPRAHRRE